MPCRKVKAISPCPSLAHSPSPVLNASKSLPPYRPARWPLSGWRPRIPVPHPIYAEWAAFHAHGGLTDSVKAWTELVDLTGARAGPTEQDAMRRAFHTSSRYEYCFWEMAARQEVWLLWPRCG